MLLAAEIVEKFVLAVVAQVQGFELSASRVRFGQSYYLMCIFISAEGCYVFSLAFSSDVINSLRLLGLFAVGPQTREQFFSLLFCQFIGFFAFFAASNGPG